MSAVNARFQPDHLFHIIIIIAHKQLTPAAQLPFIPPIFYFTPFASCSAQSHSYQISRSLCDPPFACSGGGRERKRNTLRIFLTDTIPLFLSSFYYFVRFVPVRSRGEGSLPALHASREGGVRRRADVSSRNIVFPFIFFPCFTPTVCNTAVPAFTSVLTIIHHVVEKLLQTL